MSYQQKIEKLKAEKNAIILAHYYQPREIQDIADFVGDSLDLSKKASETNANIIVFAGVRFMAETAKILNPDKIVVLPDFDAGCSLSDSCKPGKFKKLLEAHPDHIVITYINCSAEIKAMSDITCTSSNAVKIVESIPEDIPIIFAPDRNLGHYINKKTGREMLLWDGSCIVHEAFSMEKLLKLYNENPGYKIIAHPESEEHILKTATYVGSTSGMINYVKNHQKGKFIVATEAGILYKMKQEVPNTDLIAAPVNENNACACSECGYMKMNTLEKLYKCLQNESPQIYINETIRKRSLVPLKRMLELSK
jgi:quinolinate synthase